MALVIGPGFQNWVQSHSATPTSSEQDDNQFTKMSVKVAGSDGPVNGLLVYNKLTNEITFFAGESEQSQPVVQPQIPTGTLLGIDVSSNNTQNGRAPINWTAVAATQQFAFIKATEGTGYTNPTFLSDWASAKAEGMRRGAYHFAHPDYGNSAESEAQFFVSRVPVSTGDILILDLEVGDGNLATWAETFMRTVKNLTTVTPWLYSYGPFLAERGLTNSTLCQHPLWLAAYQENLPAVPAGWGHITAWQFTSAAMVPGIIGGVDQSYWYNA